MNIILKSNILEVTKIVKKTKAAMFKNVKVGDCLLLSAKVKSAGNSRGGGTYATDIKIENLCNKETTYKTFNQITGLLECFEFKEVSVYSRYLRDSRG